MLVQAGSLSQPASSRTGDYSGIAVDPSNGLTFWAINQYYGPDINNIWNTWVASFKVAPAVVNDWYTIDVAAGNTLSLQTYTPSGPGGPVHNTAESRSRSTTLSATWSPRARRTPTAAT